MTVPTSDSDYGPTLRLGETALRSNGHRCSLELLDVLADYEGVPNTVLRCSTGSESLPDSVVVKHSRQQAGVLRREAAALEFLGSLHELEGLHPRLLAFDGDSELLVMSDCGRSARLLGDVLQGTDSAFAERSLMQFQVALGRLHAACLGRQQKHSEIERRYGVSPLSRHRVNRLPEYIPKFIENARALSVAVGSSAEEELREIATIIESPGAFNTFTHGDSTPANAMVRDDGVVLIDFETAGYRHAFVDGSYSRLRYIHSVWARQIPSSIQAAMRLQYLDSFAKGARLQTERIGFDRDFCACCGAWMCALAGYVPDVMEEDKRWGLSTFRQRIIAGLEHFVDVANELNQFRNLADAAGKLSDRLKGLWSGTARMALYNAFSPDKQEPAADPELIGGSIP
ncbi:MAG: phosphotransferase [Armatimonadetes bacterium]|nr:phosphotransferase [Armatimonadota bacterium]